MSDQPTDYPPLADKKNSDYRDIVDRLLFAALKEQTRARRWRVFFFLFFAAYLTLVTVILLSDGIETLASKELGVNGKHTALVRLSGIIASGEAASAENIITGLQQAFQNPATAGVVLEINSPGGSPVQSAYIFDEIMRLKSKYDSVPLYAVVSDMAASGGYFVASAADQIYVNKSSLIGSIGVRMDSFGFVDLMKTLGVERRLLVAGKNKALLDPFLPEQKTQRAHLQNMLNQVHQHFIDAVRKGRGSRLVEREGIFSGLIWSGETALEMGLVDGYGSTGSVARQLGAEKVVDFSHKRELFDRLAERIGSQAGEQIGQYLFGDYRLH